jgi:hypothetical protein
LQPRLQQPLQPLLCDLQQAQLLLLLLLLLCLQPLLQPQCLQAWMCWRPLPCW